MEPINPIKKLQAHGQAVWLDYIRRDILLNGELERLVTQEGVSGVTSNPAIFAQAIGDSEVYDDAIAAHLKRDPNASAVDIYESLAIEDIQRTADILRGTWDATSGFDGHVSLEVSPHLARDTRGSVDEARRLWALVDRPNLLIKIPATREGIPAIELLLSEGINVNVTLMFSLAHYEAVAQAYLRAASRAEDPSKLASVASFFVSRVDSKVDATLAEIGTDSAVSLQGRIAVDNAKIAYRRFEEIFAGPDFDGHRRAGTRPQRVLWASTSTKNPAYSDVLYVEELIGPETVNTMPPETVEAFRDHGSVRTTLGEDLAGVDRRMSELSRLGIDLDQVTEELQAEGVSKFAVPFDNLLTILEEKRDSMSKGRAPESAS